MSERENLRKSKSGIVVLAFATRRREVYLTSDGGVSWRLIAEGADPRGSTATEGAR